MKSRELAVAGAFEFGAESYPDDRGFFATMFDGTAFAEAAGHPLFSLSQVCLSRSRQNVLRGVHYSATPPGRPKYAFCSSGRAYDIIVDLRVGSPTFGRHEVVVLSGDRPRAVYFPVGVGHAFVALEDDTTMCYLLSGGYVAEDELALSPFDPDLALPLPTGLEPVMSTRDSAAPSLAGAMAAGALPRYDDCRRVERELWPGSR
ncbi:dTDP-4-dehydrorhamnose 3,5-epimerase family protein [Amycolatopsis sp. NPDC059027]|uniref:dTDP-4-dehydrorhamnose 3,5-epimerase family protein n=1 Tax=unclassified Amycolatopsis TaxID=2618356 RepID=UPI00366B02FC